MAEKRYAVLIASSRFPDENRLEDLRLPENDVDGMSNVLSSPERGGFTEIILLKNNPSHEILRSINQVLRQAEREDLVLIFYSGHGKLNATYSAPEGGPVRPPPAAMTTNCLPATL